VVLGWMNLDQTPVQFLRGSCEENVKPFGH
jgi:hypothetical protein